MDTMTYLAWSIKDCQKQIIGMGRFLDSSRLEPIYQWHLGKPANDISAMVMEVRWYTSSFDAFSVLQWNSVSQFLSEEALEK
jgi:malate/lactate dehydrogenase